MSSDSHSHKHKDKDKEKDKAASPRPKSSDKQHHEKRHKDNDSPLPSPSKHHTPRKAIPPSASPPVLEKEAPKPSTPAKHAAKPVRKMLDAFEDPETEFELTEKLGQG